MTFLNSTASLNNTVTNHSHQGLNLQSNNKKEMTANKKFLLLQNLEDTLNSNGKRQSVHQNDALFDSFGVKHNQDGVSPSDKQKNKQLDGGRVKT